MTEDDRDRRQEAALLDVVRLALSGDDRSLRQRARNMLRTGNSAILSSEGREYLSSMLRGADELEPRRGRAAEPSDAGGRELGRGQAELLNDVAPATLDGEADDRVSQLIREHDHRHLLEEANLAPTTRVLLTGPPGGGKTMTARYLAARLKLPMTVAEPSEVLAGVMGESARNLSRLMRTAAERPCVLLLDELDVYARARSDAHDIAEPKRLVNTLLLELDRWPSHSLVVAASNHPEVLDAAVKRRFELQIEVGLPGGQARGTIVGNVLRDAGRDAPPELIRAIVGATSGWSGSDLVNATMSAVRRSIVDPIPADIALGQRFGSARFIGRTKKASETRRQMAVELSAAGWTIPRVAEALGVLPETAARMIAG